ncbi:MAG: lipopolysaccharide heptosyltransferase I [Nitrosomonas sp.]|nr:MAG: lipopolysaccharide heptosyltransferase I [Nitrosomonas sp.]
MKVLIVKTSSLGDVVHTFPVVAYLKQRHKDITIDWVVESACASLPEAHPDINQVHRVDIKRWRRDLLQRNTWREIAALKKKLSEGQYDVVFDLQGNTKSAMITALVPCPVKVGFDRHAVPEWPNLLATNRRFSLLAGQNIRFDYLHIVRSYFNDDTPFTDSGVILKVDEVNKNIVADILATPMLQGRQKVLVCPGSIWRNKCLPTEPLLELLRKAQNQHQCGYLMAWGNDSEKAEVERLANALPNSIVIPRLPLPALQNLMCGVDLVVAMDSLPLHLAATTSTPTYSFFGPSSAEKYKPEGSQHRSFQGVCPYGRSFDKRCPILRTCRTGACLRGKGVQYPVFSIGE